MMLPFTCYPFLTDPVGASPRRVPSTNIGTLNNIE
jgi:hypothetical protein